MVDKDRILAKLDQLEGYLRELCQILPESFEEYQKVEKMSPLLFLATGAEESSAAAEL